MPLKKVIIVGCGCGNSTGINTLSIDNTFSFYPNPATSELTINYNGASKMYQINIYDVTGKLIKQQENNSTNKNTFSISELNSGLYLLNVYDGEYSTTKKFTKQ